MESGSHHAFRAHVILHVTRTLSWGSKALRLDAFTVVLACPSAASFCVGGTWLPVGSLCGDARDYQLRCTPNLAWPPRYTNDAPRATNLVPAGRSSRVREGWLAGSRTLFKSHFLGLSYDSLSSVFIPNESHFYPEDRVTNHAR